LAARLHVDRYFDILIEPVKHRHQPVNAEPRKLALPHPRKIRRRKAGHFMRAAHADVLAVRRADDFGGEDGLELLHLGNGKAKVAEDVAGAIFDLDFVSHFSASFSRLSLSPIGWPNSSDANPHICPS
jgi:hypothetical protein